MGIVKRVLGEFEIKGQLYRDSYRIESEECRHVHWRDTRIVMSDEQFEVFKKCENATIPGNPLFKDRFVIEEIDGGTIHVHYNDVRFEISPENFFFMANVFGMAMEKMFIKNIRMDLINPYDGTHFEDISKWDSADWARHYAGINILISRIKDGNQINPILVSMLSDGSYQRRDGFKRYMAFKELGYKYIPCYVVNDLIAAFQPENAKGLVGYFR